MTLIDPSFARAKTQSRARRKRIAMNVLKYVSTHRRLVAISGLVGGVLAIVLVTTLWVATDGVSGSVQARASPSPFDTLENLDPNYRPKLKFSTTLNHSPIERKKP